LINKVKCAKNLGKILINYPLILCGFEDIATFMRK